MVVGMRRHGVITLSDRYTSLQWWLPICCYKRVAEKLFITLEKDSLILCVFIVILKVIVYIRYIISDKLGIARVNILMFELTHFQRRILGHMRTVKLQVSLRPV